MPSVHLTDRLIKTLVVQKGREEFWDRNLAGFGVRITSSSAKTFVVFFRLGGRDSEKVRMTLGKYPRLSLADARSKAKQLFGDVERGLDPRPVKIQAPEALTVADLVADFLEGHSKAGTRYGYEQKRVFEREVLPAWGDREANTISKRDVTELLGKIVRRGSPIQANRTRAIISCLFSYGLHKDLVILNPVAGTRAPSVETGRERVLTNDEIRHAWSLFGELVPSLGLHLRFKLFTLQRGCEIRTVERTHLDGGWWTVPRELTKTKRREHRVYLCGSALELLAEAKEVCAGPHLYFASPRDPARPVDVGAPAQACRRLCERHGLTPFTPHDLRRTAATHLGALGVDELLIARILSHTTEVGEKRVPTVTGVYNRYRYDAEKQAAMVLWEQRLLEILGFAPQP